MSGWDLLAMLGHFAMLSAIAVGGGLAMAPEMHRFLVDSRGWMSHQQFADSITLAQAAPGPNILFVTLLGWQAAGGVGALVATVGMMVPSSVITYAANRWSSRRGDSRVVQAIRLGMAPIAIGFTLSAGWLVALANDVRWPLAAVTLLTVIVVIGTRLNPLWLIAAGALLGIAGVL